MLSMCRGLACEGRLSPGPVARYNEVGSQAVRNRPSLPFVPSRDDLPPEGSYSPLSVPRRGWAPFITFDILTTCRYT